MTQILHFLSLSQNFFVILLHSFQGVFVFLGFGLILFFADGSRLYKLRFLPLEELT